MRQLTLDVLFKIYSRIAQSLSILFVEKTDTFLNKETNTISSVLSKTLGKRNCMIFYIKKVKHKGE